MNKKRLLLITFILLFVALGAFAYMYFTSFQMLTLNVSSVMEKPTITIYKVPSDKDVSNPALVIDDKAIVKKTTGSETIKLQKGRYYITAKSGTTADYTKDVTLGGEPQTVSVDPNLNAKLLSERLSGEESAILPVLYKTYPQINNGYVLQTGKLYGQGDWYSTSIVSGSNPNPTDYRDIFHVVLHKEDGVWKVKTRIPELNLDKYTYPNIPIDVLVQANKQGLNF